MVSEAPPFWWTKPDWRAWGLWPISSIYGAVARRRLLNARREKIDAPVLCVGNLTVGGSGKTPVAVAIANAARQMGLNPGILSRGHGGSVGSHPHLVDPHHDVAKHVGDEPLLLARAAPVAVTPDRAAGARLLINHGCDLLIMDDGFQSARIHIDYALIVVDARRGIGNGHTIPGGPMRAGLIDQMRFADGVLKMGEGHAADIVVRHAARAGRPFFLASVKPDFPEGLAGTRCLAYAGIGDPSKFYDTVRASGADLVVEKSFGDHYFFNEFDAQDLLSTAEEQSLQLVTTAKDYIRLEHGGPALEALRKASKVIEIEAVFELERTPKVIIQSTLDAYRRRRLTA